MLEKTGPSSGQTAFRRQFPGMKSNLILNRIQ